MAAQFCSTCGTPATAGDRFCRKCGETLYEATMDLPRDVAQGRMDELTPQAGMAAYPPSGQQFGYSPAPPAGYGYGYGTAVADSKPLAQFDVQYPASLSRGLIFIKWLLAVPHFIVLYVFGAVVGLVVFIAFFAILFTGRFPPAMHSLAVGYMRWLSNVAAYLYLLRDEYPPFSMEPGRYPVYFSLDCPSHLSRGLIFIKWLLVIPSALVVGILGYAAMFCTVVAWFAILFTGRYPEGMFRFVVGVYRWSMRVYAYAYLLTDRYPPFSTAADPA